RPPYDLRTWDTHRSWRGAWIMRRSSWLLAGLLGVLGAAGCHAPPVVPAGPAAPAADAAFLPVVERGDLEAALPGATPTDAVTRVRYTTVLKTYRALTPEQCAPLAGNASHLAALYRLEEQAAPERPHHGARVRCTRQGILQLVALEA